MTGPCARRLARPGPARPLVLAVCAAAVGVGGCTTEDVVGVEVRDVGVTPPAVTLVQDDSIQLTAEVHDEQGELLEGAAVTWASDRPSVVTVSARGVASGVGAGTATVTASFGGVRGTSTVTVLSNAALDADPDVVVFRGAVGEAAPRSEQVEVRDLRGGSLQDLGVRLEYPSGGLDWVGVDVRRRPDRVTLTLTPRTSGMPAGRYEAAAIVSGPSTPTGPLAVPISLTLAGLTVTETDGGTVVTAEGDTDRISVALQLRPEVEVVLAIESEDPSLFSVDAPRLVFTPDDWDEARTVTVRGEAAATSLRHREAEIEISVVEPESDPAYHPVPAVEVDVVKPGLFPALSETGMPRPGTVAPRRRR